ncbi:helix-turn-helix domain-containing protein [Cytobacillus massiliigabonensis]|uniref:helix-turn-helix domain-containing protein n=1 Tax=Cytobacillus massiliigabonensis TaxID=1871011 RepID=UPI000C8494D4|nr:AraC family transcriptional regulator [Cytobacillus massiliigabonensis]
MRNSNDQVKAVIAAIEYMQKHLDEEITSEELASLAGYSPYHFSRFFKVVTGVSPRHYLSALRIEAGKRILVDSSSSSILKTLLTIGFRSMGTFSTKFKQFVGLSPKQFQLRTEDLHEFINQYERQDKLEQNKLSPPVVTCHLEVPEGFKGLIFIGLFPRPIPDQRPVAGTAITHNRTNCVFSSVPLGTYYVLAAALPLSFHPKDYFLLDTSLRGKSDHAIEVTEGTAAEVKIKLRDPMPYDPPILINLPQLLFEKVKNKAN